MRRTTILAMLALGTTLALSAPSDAEATKPKLEVARDVPGLKTGTVDRGMRSLAARAAANVRPAGCPPSHGGWLRRSRGGWRCVRGSRVAAPVCRRGTARRSLGRRRWVCVRRRSTPAPAAAPQAPAPQPAPQPAAPQQENLQWLIDAAYSEAIRHGKYVVSSYTDYYYWQVYGSECVLLNGDAARCTLYLWKSELGNGFGGLIGTVWRQHVVATRVGDHIYSTRFNLVDVIDPYAIACTDSPYNPGGIPRCT